MIKIKGYSNEELEYIKKNYKNKTVNELSKELNKSCNSVYTAIRKLGLIKQPHNKWTDTEIRFLREHYIDMTSEEISKHINHTVDAINTQRDRLGLIRNESWTEKEIEFLKHNYECMSYHKIGKKLNRTEQAICAKCFDLNLYKKELPWTDEEKEFVRKNYMEMPTADIAKILNRTPSSIQIKAKRMGLKKYPYMCDYHYFDEINTEEKAYWLGFLTADGWISKNNKSNAGVVGIELQYKDINHLRKLNKSIGGNYKITDRWKKCLLSDAQKKHHMCVIRIFSLIMYESLQQLGLHEDKTYNINVPKISSDLLRHYLRGYFDGDGCFCLTAKSFGVSFITASKSLSNDIEVILSYLNVSYKMTEYLSEYNTQMYRIYIYKIDDKLKLLDYMYKDSSIYLDRKYKKYIKVKEKYDPRNGLAT